MTQMVHLEDVATEVTVGHVGSMADEYIDVGVPFLRSLNVLPHRVSIDEVKFISREFHKKLRKSALKPGDVVIVRTGKPGICAVIPDTLPESNCSDLVIVRCGPDLRPRFLAYWVNTIASEHIASHIVGAVQQHFNVGAAKRMPLRLPCVGEQDDILAILGALDDKIELNRKTAGTLEEMARALYRSWFVDFDPVWAKAEGRPPAHMDEATAALFPDSFGNNGLPAGWDIKPLSSLCVQVKDTIDPRKNTEQTFDHYSLPAFDAGNGPVRELGSAIQSQKLVIPTEAILFSRLNPTISRIWWARTSDYVFASVASTEFLVAVARGKGDMPFLYSLLISDEFRGDVIARVTGTSNSHQRVKPASVLEIEVCGATAEVRAAYGNITKLWFNRVNKLARENQSLATLRDTLLPKLMSGELRVGEAQDLIEAVA